MRKEEEVVEVHPEGELQISGNPVPELGASVDTFAGKVNVRWVPEAAVSGLGRLDLHPHGVKVSVFAASVINAIDGQIDHHIEGNNIYGLYSSFSRLIPHPTVEPYLFWRVAPGNVTLPETAGHGHLNEITGGARLAGTLHGDFDYDVEMNTQAGSLGHYSINA